MLQPDDPSPALPTHSVEEFLDIAATFRGKRLLFVGATGFVGKVVLSMLLRRYPDIGKLFILVRPGAGSSSDERFFQKIATSPVFSPLREVWPEGAFDAFLRERCVPLPGDVARPMLNFGDAEFEKLGHLDAIINCAGLVSFNPSLETALRINVLGPKHTLEVARKTGAAVVHVSTCFVAGERDGEIWEDEPLLGYFPRKSAVQLSYSGNGRKELYDDDFSVEAEIADCQRLIDQVKARADDRAHVSLFRDQAAERLRADGRDADDERTLKVAVQRERKIWVSERLTELGMERARHWGWTNTYTYTKSLGDQMCAEATDVRTCIVRPAIVESALRYPFAGWNEGFTTTAPLAFLNIKGHRTYPAGEGVRLDVIPVDLVAAGLIMATAATVAGQNELVYQLGSSDSNPLFLKRAVVLLGLHKRRYFQNRDEGSTIWNQLLARMEPIPVSKERYQRGSAPLWKSVSKNLATLIDDVTPRWGAPRLQGIAERAKERLSQIASLASQTDDLFQLFMPFIYDRRYIFRCDHTRALFARLTPQDKQALPWDPESIDWRQYWLDIHMKGLETWVFPSLEEEFAARPRSVYTYKDLLELFDATTKHHRNRTAMRLLPPVGRVRGEAQRYTYGDLANLANEVAVVLRARGVRPGDHVMLISENRPEWGITYFGVLKAGATVVPIDSQSTLEEVQNLIAYSHARAIVWSDKVAARLHSIGTSEIALTFDDLFTHDLVTSGRAPSKMPPPIRGTESLVQQPRAEQLASLIFTSGTTGRPKGVMLSHRNFTSLLSKLASVFDLDRHDGLLSVLPLHHTLEFSAGLLMPLMRGAHVNYLDEVNAEALKAALDNGDITGMVGVPALWQLLERRIRKQVQERGTWAMHLFNLILQASHQLHDRLPPVLAQSLLNFPRLVFWPLHTQFGGRLRLLISGASALDPDTLKSFRGLGFNLYEGYGLTEASPVLTVVRPGTRSLPGSVGEPLPGIEVKIHEPDAHGVGEVIASGPNVMVGYFENPEATADTLRSGWLHTGDLGRFDEEGKRLYLVGRKKEMILGPNGENVYPDELEELYRDSPYVKELSIVGLPQANGGETVACLIVPNDEAIRGEVLGREELRNRLLTHVKNVSVKLPLHKRIKITHFTDVELPKTSTRKVKRKLVVVELEKLERLKRQGEESRETAQGAARKGDWLQEMLATVAGRPRGEVAGGVRFQDLGFDSLMFSELGVALEAAGIEVPEEVDLTGIETVADFEKLVGTFGSKRPHRLRERRLAPRDEAGDADEIEVPSPVVTIGRAGLTFAQRMTYERLFQTRVTGRAHIPKSSTFIVAANHASHLDMGLVKHALGDWGPRLVALAAKDYFFEVPIKRAYFENFTNLVPMDRHGSLRESLRLASEVIRQGSILLIFPEGTRSPTGVMADFKPSIGYLALTNEIDILPLYLEGTYQALPKGSVMPKSRTLAAHIGPLITIEKLREVTRAASKSEAYKLASAHVEAAVRRLAPKGSRDRLMSVAPEPKERRILESVATVHAPKEASE
jgi:long-chain acyl-CoA synthetase